MEQRRRLDRRNRQWGSLRDGVSLRVRLSKRTKAILSALRKCDHQQISYGEVIEKLAERHAGVLGQPREKHDSGGCGTRSS